MYGNGVGIGKEITHPQAKRILRDPHRANIECFAAGVGVATRGAAVWRVVAAPCPAAGTGTSASGSHGISNRSKKARKLEVLFNSVKSAIRSDKQRE